MVKVHARLHVQEHVLAVGQALDVQIEQGIHEVAGIHPRAHIADASLILKDGVMDRIMLPVPGDCIMPELVSSCRARVAFLEGIQRIPRPGGYADGPLGGVGEDMGFRCGNVQALKHPGGEVLGVLLGLGQQLRVVRVQEQCPNLAAQGEGCHKIGRASCRERVSSAV